MSRGQSQRRTDSRKIALERCKSKGKEYDVIDIDSDRIPNFIIIDAPESSDWTFVEASTSGKDKIPVYRNIIFVDDDDDDDDDNESGDCGSSQDGFDKDENQDANFTARNKYQPSCNQGGKFSSESSKCRATCSRKISSFNHQKFPSNLSFENGDSDCDIVEDYMGNIRRQWEEASLRKKRNVLKGQSGCQDEVDPLLFTNSQNLVDVIKTAEAFNANHQNNNLNNMVDVKTPEEPSGNYQNNNFNPSACVGEDTIGDTSNKSDLEETFQPERSCCSTQVVNETTLKPLANTQSLISINPSTELSSGDSLSDGQHCIIGNREMLKKTNAYKRAEEEEWASRQRELEIQAKEARRLRKRRKAETLRLLETERRQKQRVEEVREAQKKDKETLNLKEQLRSEVRREIDKLEVNCNDMASLLHGLGIDIGGLFPSPSEVRAAYKQALLKFHPDRASRSDIRQQIEAEEKFKLITRAKERFML